LPSETTAADMTPLSANKKKKRNPFTGITANDQRGIELKTSRAW